MKTEVIMKRELFGKEISQKSKTEMFSATDLVRAGNEQRLLLGKKAFNMSAWLNINNTKEFMEELSSEYGKIIIKGRGRSAHTWVHPLLFIDMALAISPKLKIDVYKWLHDSLLKHRNNSGDSYKLMAGAIFTHIKNKAEFQRYIVSVASQIKLACHVSDWQKATISELELRDRMHHNISLIANILRDNDQAVDLGIKEALKQNNRKLK